MAHAIPRSLIPVIALFLVTGTAEAEPVGIPISETPLCRVSLSKLSYDGPGADDEEFVELVVERFVADAGGPLKPPGAGSPDPAPPPVPPCNTSHDPSDASIREPDATPRTDARADAPYRAPTLGDCGLGELRLVNGGSGACDDYRVIPLGSVVVPDDGFVLLCAQDSLFAALCDVDTAGRSVLRNGFLQNGPTDGLRFLDTSGAATLEVAYEGAPACFSSGALVAVDESGEISGSPGTDDVNVSCGGRFELVPATDAPLRTRTPCASPAPIGSAYADAGAPLPTRHADSGPSSPRPEFAPDVGAGYRGFSIPDAGLPLPPESRGAPLEPPSCRASPGRGPVEPWPLAIVLAVEALRRRRRRPPAALRAGCSARCETALRRSP